MKRILVIFLCFTLILSLLVVPAFATDTGLVSGNILDLVSEFTWYWDDMGDDFSTDSPTASLIFDGYDVDCVFSFNEHFICDGLTLVLDCDEDIDIELSFTESNGQYITRPGEVISQIDNRQTWHFNIGTAITGLLEFTFYRNAADDVFDISLISLVAESAYGLNGSIYNSLNMVGFKVTGTALNRLDQQYYQATYYDNDVIIPYTYNQNTFTDPPTDNIVNVFISASGQELVGADRLVLTFISTGIWDNYYDHDALTQGGIYLNAKETEFDLPSVNIPISAYYSKMDSSWYGLNVYRTTIVADVSNYDLSNYDIVFSTSLNGRFPNYNNSSFVDFYFRLESFGSYTDSDFFDPWYRRLANWIDSSIDSMSTRVTNSISTVRTLLSNLFTVYWDKLDTKLNEIFGQNESPPNINDQQQAIDDSLNDMGQLGDSLENSRNELESLTPDVPSWEDTGLDGFGDIVASHIRVIRPVYLVIFENNIISQIITYTFLFALGGFILFGER